LKNDIVSIKLLSGEEIIARLEEEKDHAWVVEKPVCLGPQENGVAFAPFLMTTEAATVSINKATVVTVVPTHSSLAKSYTESTTSIKIT